MKLSSDINTIQPYISQEALEAIFAPPVHSLLQLHYFDKNEQIITESSAVKYLYLVLEGDARVSPSSEEGKIGFLEFIYPGDIIGDIEYFSKDAYYHNVIALSSCIYLAIPVALIDSHFNKNINFYRFICENMASKLKRTSASYSRAMLYPLKNRLAMFIIEESIRVDSLVIDLSPSQIAAYFGVTPRHLRRVLNELIREDLITKELGHISIRNRHTLERYTKEYL